VTDGLLECLEHRVSLERFVQHQMQRVLGFDRYLYWFSRVKSRTLRWDRYEKDVRRFIEMIPTGAAALDIGANIGIMTAPMARRVTERGTVFAYEPIPENLAVLRRIVARYDQVEVHGVALGDEAGELQMVMPVQEQVRMQGLSHVAGPDDEDAGQRYTVRVCRLDDRPELDGVDVAAIKVDVENFEAHVFRGGRALLERCRPLVYTELWDGPVRGETFELFEEMDYAVRVLDGNRLVAHDPAVHQQHNFFLCPR
jgi:FkbM family methyltransferase